MAALYVCVAMVALALGACVTTGPLRLHHSTRLMSHIDANDAFRAAERALLDEGFAIGRRDAIAGVIVTRPVDLPSVSRRNPATIGLSTVGKPRRVAQVRIIEHDGIVRISCRVELQELATEAQRLFEEQYAGFDRTDDTPIDRGAAATREQNTVWQTTRRDKRAENRILAAITGALGSSADPARDTTP